MPYRSIAVFLVLSYSLGFGAMHVSAGMFWPGATYQSEASRLLWFLLRATYFIGLVLIWYQVNRKLFPVSTWAAHVVSALILLYCVMVGGVFAGVGM